MPRFAANIAYLFSEIPLTERPAAAAKGGFAAVEVNSPTTRPRQCCVPRSKGTI